MVFSNRLDGRTVNARASCAGGREFRIPKIGQRFATASISTQVAVLPWRYGTEIGTANSLINGFALVYGPLQHQDSILLFLL